MPAPYPRAFILPRISQACTTVNVIIFDSFVWIGNQAIFACFWPIFMCFFSCTHTISPSRLDFTLQIISGVLRRGRSYRKERVTHPQFRRRGRQATRRAAGADTKYIPELEVQGYTEQTASAPVQAPLATPSPSPKPILQISSRLVVQPGDEGLDAADLPHLGQPKKWISFT